MKITLSVRALPCEMASADATTQPTTFPIEDPDRVAFEMVIRGALQGVQRHISDRVYVSGSCALWLADKDAKWEPDDIDIAVPTKHWFDLVGRLVCAGKERVKKEASGFCFEKPLKGSKLGRDKIRVQVFPVCDPLAAVAHYDLDGVRCYARPFGTFSMQVIWVPGVDTQAILDKKVLTHYVAKRALDEDGNIEPKYVAMRKRVQKYVDRGYTIQQVVSEDAEDPYAEGYRWSKPNLSPPGAIDLCNQHPTIGINWSTLVTWGYSGNETRRLAARWLEQVALNSARELSQDQLWQLAMDRKPPPFPLDEISLAQTGMSGCEWADARKWGEKLWIKSGFTLTKEQLLEKVGMTLPQPEMQPEDLFA